MISFFCFLLLLSSPNSGKSVTFSQDSRVNTLVRKHIESNQVTPVNGYRINIFFQSGNHSRTSAMNAQNAFSDRFPNMKSYVSFEEPYFRVNVGNFRTRLEAAAALQNLKLIYPQAYVIRDVLNVRDLLEITTVGTDYDDDF
ncbi:MAG: SPOR domain-containing protein [Bacteroidales bacterium]|nr:SPOR domain-containing protein [Bacteroidales bacterium]